METGSRETHFSVFNRTTSDNMERNNGEIKNDFRTHLYSNFSLKQKIIQHNNLKKNCRTFIFSSRKYLLPDPVQFYFMRVKNSHGRLNKI
jgi:hypothetical protein